MKELLADKNRLKIDVRIVYGKSKLQPQEREVTRPDLHSHQLLQESTRQMLHERKHVHCHQPESL